MSQSGDQQFETRPDIQLAQFGLSEGFVESLSPDDLRGVLSAIAKYAAVTRHPDRLGSRTDYSFGTTDARSLTAFAGRLTHMSNEEVAELQRGFSEDKVVKEYRDHAFRLGELFENQQEELRAVKAKSLELLVSEVGEGTIAQFEGIIISKSGAASPNLVLLDIENGGKVKSAKEVRPIDKEFVKDSEPWVQEVCKAAQKRDDEDKGGTLLIVKQGDEVAIKNGDTLISLSDLGIEADIESTTAIQGKPTPIQLFSISPSVSRRTGNYDKPVFVTYSTIPRRYTISQNSHIVGFVDNEWLWTSKDDLKDLMDITIKNTPLGIPALPSASFRKEQERGSKVFNHISTDHFWRHLLTQKGAFSRSITPSNRFSPILYDPSTNNSECLVLGAYQVAVENKGASRGNY